MQRDKDNADINGKIILQNIKYDDIHIKMNYVEKTVEKMKSEVDALSDELTELLKELKHKNKE